MPVQDALPDRGVTGTQLKLANKYKFSGALNSQKKSSVDVNDFLTLRRQITFIENLC